MIIGDKKLEALKKMPVIETVVFKSKDGKYIVNKTTITDIKPVNFFRLCWTTNQKSESGEATPHLYHNDNRHIPGIRHSRFHQAKD